MNVQRNWSKLDVPRKVKLTIADFLRLNDAGAFDAYSKTELIDGEIVAVNSQFTGHARFKSLLSYRIQHALETTLPDYVALVEVSVAIPPQGFPEPDIVITNFKETGRVPVPVEMIAFIVEIADSTLRFDLGKKAKLYAAASVPEYWVADLQGGIMHQLWMPVGKQYTQRREVPFGQRVESTTIAGLGVETVGI
jgi:Uma2 family endonuclease